MATSRIQQLVKYSALHFVHHKIYNLSLLELLCQQQKVHASTTSEQIQKNIIVVDKGFQLLKDSQKAKRQKIKSKHPAIETSSQIHLFSMVNIFIFNVSAINQHYINEMEKHMTQSTASQSLGKSMNETFYKDKMGIQILKQHLRQYFVIFTDKSKFIHGMIAQIVTSENKMIAQSQLGLLQTLDYLCVKYSIKNDTSQKIVNILQKNDKNITQSMSQMYSSGSIKEINRLLFSQNKQIQLFQMLQTNSHINFKNIVSIIDTNYLNQNPSRKIFQTADISGKQAIQSLIARILSRVSKNELFGQKTEQYTPFRALLYHFLDKHFPVYIEFNRLVKQLMGQNEGFKSEQSLKVLTQIQKYFRLFIPIQNQSFHYIMQFTYSQLLRKFSQPIALQLIKKLILNRFLLNPSFYVLYNEPNQNQIKRYVQVANFIRTLFYANKAQELAEKIQHPHLKKLSAQICYSIDYCLKKEKDAEFERANLSFLYVNDKILKGNVDILYEELKQGYKSPREGANLHNMVSEYSLSFSLVKNEHPTKNHLASNPLLENLSEVRFAVNTNRSNTNVKDNQSIRIMYDQLKDLKSQTSIPSRSPQKGLRINTKTENKSEKLNFSESGVNKSADANIKQQEPSHQTRLYSMRLPTDRQMIEELVELRKQYGERKKTLRLHYESRKARNKKKLSNLKAFSARFDEYRSQIEHQNNVLYINMTSFA